jgi:hypothetical protein
VTTNELKDLVDAAISTRMSGGTIDEWSEGSHRVAHMPLNQLLNWQRELANQLEQETGGCAMPVVDVNL